MTDTDVVNGGDFARSDPGRRSGSRRKAALALVRTKLEAGDSVVVFSEWGLGKTFVANAVSDHLIERGFPVIRVEGASRDVAADLEQARSPHSIDPVTVSLDSPNSDTRSAHRSTRTVLRVIVDDVHLLDDDAVTQLAALARDPRIALLALSETPSGSRSRESRTPGMKLLADLWRDRLLWRVDLERMSAFESVSFLNESTSGAALDLGVSTSLIGAAGGSPSLLGELIAEAIESPRSIFWSSRLHSRSPVRVPQRLREIADRRLDDLDEEEVRDLVTLGRLGQVSYARAASLIGRDRLSSLITAGLVDSNADTPDLIFASPFYCTVLLAEVGDSSPRPALVDRLRIDREAGYSLGPGEATILAERLLDQTHSGATDRALTPGDAEVLTRAAMAANLAGDFNAAREFAFRAFETHHLSASAVQLSRALAGLDCWDAALTAFEHPDIVHDRADDDFEMLHRWGLLIGERNLASEPFAALIERARSWCIDGTVIDQWVDFLHANLEFTSSAFRLGRDRLERLASDPQAPIVIRIRCLSLLAMGAGMRGDDAAMRRTLVDARALDVDSARTDGRFSEGTIRDVIRDLRLACGVARIVSGVDLDHLERDLTLAAIADYLHGDHESLGMTSVLRCTSLMLAGRPVDTLACLESAPPEVARRPNASWSAWRRMLATISASATGTGAPRLSTQSSVSLGNSLLPSWPEIGVGLSLTFTRAAMGDLAGARATLLELIDGAAKPFPPIHAQLLILAVSLGESAEQAAARLPKTWSTTSTPPSNAIADVISVAVTALVGQDAATIDSCADRLEQLGVRWEALVLWRRSRVIHESRGNSLAARASAAHAQSLSSRGFMEPAGFALRARWSAAPASVLTRREREIAHLVAAGQSNADIAAALFLSLRTVESHVFQAKLKLRAPHRSDFARLLDQK